MPNPKHVEVPEEAVEAVLVQRYGVKWKDQFSAAALGLRAQTGEDLQAAAPIIASKAVGELLNDPIRVSFCHACGYVDDPHRSSCANCGAQMQGVSKPLVDLARDKAVEEERERARRQINALRVYSDEEIAARRAAMEGWVRIDDVLAALKSEIDDG